MPLSPLDELQKDEILVGLSLVALTATTFVALLIKLVKSIFSRS